MYDKNRLLNIRYASKLATIMGGLSGEGVSTGREKQIVPTEG